MYKERFAEGSTDEDVRWLWEAFEILNYLEIDMFDFFSIRKGGRFSGSSQVNVNVPEVSLFPLQTKYLPKFIYLHSCFKRIKITWGFWPWNKSQIFTTFVKHEFDNSLWRDVLTTFGTLEPYHIGTLHKFDEISTQKI